MLLSWCPGLKSTCVVISASQTEDSDRDREQKSTSVPPDFSRLQWQMRHAYGGSSRTSENLPQRHREGKQTDGGENTPRRTPRKKDTSGNVLC